MASARIGRGLAAWAGAIGLTLALASGPAASAATVPTPAMAPIADGVELIMVEQPGCWYCAQWKAEVMPEYALTAEGRAAPLRIVPLAGPWPDGLVLGRRPVITPTFILVRGGEELSRLEGYPGEDFFWPLIADMLGKAGIDVAQAEAGAGTGD